MKARKNRAFFIETLIVTFLLLLMLTILVRIFGAAAQKSQNAERKTRAAQIAQNVITMFEASEGNIGQTQQSLMAEANESYDMTDIPQETLTFSFNEDGEEDAEGTFGVSLTISCELRAVGFMLVGNMTVFSKDDPQTALAQLDTAKYFPDSAEIVLLDDVEISFDEIAEIDLETESESENWIETEAETQEDTAKAPGGAETEVAS